MDTPSSFERHLDDLVPILADVIRHAQELQRSAKTAVEQSMSMSIKVDRATNALTTTTLELESRLAAQVVAAVAKPFDDAVGRVAGAILADMHSVKNEADKAIANLTTASDRAARVINERSKAVERKLLSYIAASFIAGALFGASLVLLTPRWLS